MSMTRITRDGRGEVSCYHGTTASDAGFWCVLSNPVIREGEEPCRQLSGKCRGNYEP
jgi:hypothetical protein